MDRRLVGVSLAFSIILEIQLKPITPIVMDYISNVSGNE